MNDPTPEGSVRRQAAEEDRISNVPDRLFDPEAGKLQRYQDLIVGRRGLGRLVLYELVTLVSSWVPGALGLLLRSKLYPLLLGECGRNVNFGTNVILRHPHKIRIGDDVAIDDNCVLDAKGVDNDGIRIGDRVFVGRNTILACKDGDIELRDGANISYQCILFSGNRVVVGRSTMLAAFCYLVGGEHHFERVDVAVADQDRSYRGIEIGAEGWLGAGVKVLDGVRVGDGAIVGANAVVRDDIPDRAVAAGIPARIVRERSPEDEAGDPAGGGDGGDDGTGVDGGFAGNGDADVNKGTDVNRDTGGNGGPDVDGVDGEPSPRSGSPRGDDRGRSEG